jgi:hypothetical protein
MKKPSRETIVRSTFVVEFLAKLGLMISFIRAVSHLEISQFAVVLTLTGLLFFLMIIIREYNYEMIRMEKSIDTHA